MIVKFDSFERKSEDYSNFKIFLFHGSNEGKIIECKNQVLKLSKIEKKEKEIINIHSSEMKKDDFSNLSLRLDEQNIFGFMMFVNIYLSNERNNQEIIQLIDDIENSCNNNIVIIIRSNQLPPRSKLRKKFEANNNLIIIPCYEDDEFEKNMFIKNFLANEGITFSSKEIQEISKKLPNQRLEIKNELEKISIILKVSDKPKEVGVLCSGISGSQEINAEKFISSIVKGEDKTFLTEYNKFTNFGQDNIRLINYLIEHLFRILISQSRMNQGMSINSAVSSLKPPVFFKNLESFKTQIKNLESSKLRSIIKRLYECKKQILEGKVSAQYLLLVTLLKFHVR